MPLTYSDIRDELSSAIYGDYRVTILWTRLHEKGSGYEDAYAYAIRVGTVTGNILRKYQPEDLADWDLENLIPGTLGLNHNMVVAACREAQRNLNALARIGILPQLPDFDGNRAFGLVEAVRKRGKIGPSFYDQVTNFDLNVVDQSVRKNAEFQFSAGLNPKIVRTAASKCCEWCDKLAGTYDYYKISNTGNPVWRRHDNCRCLILYNPGDGSKRRQNVHTKRWTEENKADRIALAGNTETARAVNHPMANGPRRGPLQHVSNEEERLIRKYADDLKIPQEVLSFNTGHRTSFDDGTGLIHVRGDVFPADYAPNKKSILNERCVLAHEYYGHMMHAPSHFSIGDWRDEFSASYWAALDTPNLTGEERSLLMVDAFERAKIAGVKVTMNTEARRIVYGVE